MPPVKELGPRVTLDLTQQPALPADYNTFLGAAQVLEVKDEQSYAIAAQMIQKSAAWDASVDSFFDEGRELAHRSWKWFTGTISKLKAPYAVRDVLEPKMKRFRRQQEDARRAEEERLAREARAAIVKAEQEAAEIRRKAEEEAARLRREGEMRAAREVVTQATEQAAQVVEVADSLADLGTIAPAEPKFQGVGESRPWVAVIDNISHVLKDIAEGNVDITAEESEKLQKVLQPILNRIAKRMGKTDIGVRGAHGERDVTLRFSKGIAPVQIGHAAPEGEKDGW